MTRAPRTIDRPFLLTTLALLLLGVFIFSSASLGLLTRSGASFSSLAISQFLFGVGGGIVVLTILANVRYRYLKRIAPHLFGVALLLTALVFVPGLGYEANGARRWLEILNVSFQPAELLKVSFILVLAWFYSTHHRKINDIRYALGGLLGALLCTALVLLPQPDTGTFAILALTGGVMALAAGIRWHHVFTIVGVGLIALSILAFARPYLLDRVTTFLDPLSDPRGSGYQIKQSLIAVGSGGVFGRGYGQSVQKFNYLPEPVGDSIFSVAAEEFGFVGSVTILGLFVLFAFRGLLIASRATDRFGGLVAVGLVILIVIQSFINISSMVGLMPLTGEPLVFISQGGTSLLFALASAGIILNISRYQRPRVLQTV